MTRSNPPTEVERAESESNVDAEETPDERARERDDPGASPDPEQLPLSQVFGLLSNARRRRTLRVLRDRGGSATLSDVAEMIAAWENDKEVGSLTSSERKRTYVGLYQCHLPKMADSGVIRFDKHRGNIELGPNASRVFEYLEDPEPERDRPWAHYYLALAGIWGIVLLGQWGGVPIPDASFVTALQLVTFSLCGIAHYRDTTGGDEESSTPTADPGDGE